MSLLPRIPTSQNKLPLQKIQQPEITALYAALQQIENKPNTVTRLQFRPFEPLFRKDSNLSEQQVEDLTTLYRKTFDLYKETVIIESADNPTIILRLPPVLTPIRPLSPTPRNATLVDINTKMSGQLPAYSSTAFGRMADALIAEQKANKDVIASYRNNYNQIVSQFNQAYSKKTSTTAIPVAQKDTSVVFDNTTWGFEE